MTSNHDLYHNSGIDGPVEGCEQCAWETRDRDVEDDGFENDPVPARPAELYGPTSSDLMRWVPMEIDAASVPDNVEQAVRCSNEDCQLPMLESVAVIIDGLPYCITCADKREE